MPEVGCVLSATFPEAQRYCASAGLRLCSTSELEVCCGTGCTHDSRPVWVSPPPRATTTDDAPPAFLQLEDKVKSFLLEQKLNWEGRDCKHMCNIQCNAREMTPETMTRDEFINECYNLCTEMCMQHIR